MNSPLVIWTLQRTGGTNLTSYLSQRSGLAVVPHEPFNVGRIWGHITEKWGQDKDERALASTVRELCCAPSVIKHCVEVIPPEVSRALATATTEAGFKHFFLYRRDPLDRLLSLHFARQTGIWGPGKAANSYSLPEERTELPVEQLIAHEARCTRELTTVWNLLKSLGCAPYAMAFEDLYRAPDQEHTTSEIEKLFNFLSWTDIPPASQMASEIASQGNQGTKQKYNNFIGIDALSEALADAPHFDPS